MVMWFHPGLAIGHTYYDSESVAHPFSTTYSGHDLDDPLGGLVNADSELLEEPESTLDSDASMDSMDCWEDDVDSQELQSGGEEEINDDEFLALHDMYES
jgi:hypothetical protein